jgi:hypothetical protein
LLGWAYLAFSFDSDFSSLWQDFASAPLAQDFPLAFLQQAFLSLSHFAFWSPAKLTVAVANINAAPAAKIITFFIAKKILIVCKVETNVEKFRREKVF